jgi:hypothetical protein
LGYEVLSGAAHGIGFRVDPLGGVHTPARAIEYAAAYVSQLNFALTFWPVPAIVLLIATLWLNNRWNRWDALLLTFFGAQVVAYSLYWGYSDFLGPRFLYTAYAALLIVIARGLLHVAVHSARLRTSVLAFVVGSVAVAWLAPMSYAVRGWASQLSSVRQTMRVDYASLVHDAGLKNAVVFIRESMSLRLTRRLWGAGVPRRFAAQLMATRDACSLLAAVNAAEGDPTLTPRMSTELIDRMAVPYRQVDNVRTKDPAFRISSAESLTPLCREELDNEQFVAASFGPALLLEPLDADGKIAQTADVIFVQDLGRHNEVLRRRFGNRDWYRVVIAASPRGALVPSIISY